MVWNYRIFVLKWHGDNAGDVESMLIDGLGADWGKPKNNTTTNDNGNANQETTYYYNKTKNQALIKLGNFVDGKERDTYSVDVQVVCKVTDSDVLHGIKRLLQMKLNCKRMMDKQSIKLFHLYL